jgi:hypothetical protein
MFIFANDQSCKKGCIIYVRQLPGKPSFRVDPSAVGNEKVNSSTTKTKREPNEEFQRVQQKQKNLEGDSNVVRRVRKDGVNHPLSLKDDQ